MVQPEYPPQLRELFESQDEIGKEFRKNIRGYNQLFAFTSMGVNLDTALANAAHGVYTFRAHGEAYHQIGDLLPSSPNDKPKFLQLYVYDTENEEANRHNVASYLQRDTIRKVMDILHSINPYVATLKSVSQLQNIKDCQLVFKSDTELDQRVYNTPTASQVAMIWVDGENSDEGRKRDVVIYPKGNTGLRRISELSAAYDPLQYPLLFPQGESGWHIDVLTYVAPEI